MSILNVNQIQPVGSGQTVTISATNIDTGSATFNIGAGKSIKLYGATSGYSEIVAAAGSASTTFTLPANGGINGQYLQTDGTGSLSWQTVSSEANVKVVAATAQTLSGSSTGFTGLPSTTFYIQLLLHDALWAAGSSLPVFQIGDSGGYETTGYDSTSAWVASYGVGNSANINYGFSFGAQTGLSFSLNAFNGMGHLTKINGNSWVYSFTAQREGYTDIIWGSGAKTLSDTLDRVRIIENAGVNGASGTFNIVYYYTV